MTEKPTLADMGVHSANLWTRIMAQCLNVNPYIRKDEDGKTTIECPRCHREAPAEQYRVLGIESEAMEWSATIRKCMFCSHLFAFVG